MFKEDLKHITIENLLDTNQISVRASNCCISTGLDTLYKIVSYFEDKGSFFKEKIRNAGQKTCEELDELCTNVISKIKIEKQYTKIEEIYKVINELTEQEREMLLSFANLIVESENILKKKKLIYEKYCTDDFSFVTDFYIKNGHLPMFWILEQYIVNDKSRDIDILTSTFNIIQNKQKLSLKEIAEKYNLTRERARQIREDVFRKTLKITDEDIEYKKSSKLIKYGQLLQNKCDWSYILESELLKKTNLSKGSFEIQEYLKKEQYNLSAEFALQVIAYLLRDTFSLFGGLETSSRGRLWENAFLIRKDFLDIFDFEKFMKEFTNHISNNETEYDLNIDELLLNSNYWISVNELNNFDNIASIVKDILLHVFHFYSKPDGSITIPAMKKKPLLKIVYEILQNNGNPMHLDEVFIEFKKILPEHKYTKAEQLRHLFQRHEAISFRNRKSIYTLKEWKHVKSGTIRDVIIEFLSENDLPQTTDSITKYVLQHFPETNIASVKSTMFADSLKRFSFFNDSLFGLATKEYPSEYKETKRQRQRQQLQRQTFEQRISDLEKFISESNHFPFSSSYNKNERSLYDWWLKKNRNIAQLSEQQKADIDRIRNQYADFDTDKLIYDWFINFNNLKLFVLENRRLPSASGSEKCLYDWFHRAKDDFDHQNLNKKQRNKYVELFKEINYTIW